MTHLYDNNLNFLVSLNYEYEDFIKEPSKFYPEWKSSFYATQDKYNNPVVSDGALREKTREELILIDNKCELLADGEYIEQGKIIVVPCPEGLLKKKWDRTAHVWGEGATVEELKEFYFDLINKYKAEILQVGFDFNGHQQKCREKDLALLGNAIAANEDAQIYSKTPVSHWSFNDNDVVEMSLEDLKHLRIAGATFVQVIFTVEAQLKASQPDILLEKQDFIKKVNELSTVKCFKSSI
ncbi:MAG: hypothetical protein ACLVH9_10785 [Fusobacterium sp.]|uniref:DUF4376 domain-containing protein n=1 Tax=Fusobacterium sp. TaxID=68766 RepID=UPI00399B33CF